MGSMVLLLGLASCGTPRYFQVISTASVDAVETNGFHVYENEEVKITYDFWGVGGKMGFTVENKMSSAIYIDWNRSHLIHSGVSYEYWTDSEETTSMYASSSSGFALSNNAMYPGMGSTSGNTTTVMSGKKSAVSSTVQYRPKPILHIPPGSKVQFARFQLLADGIYDCDFHWTSEKTSDLKERTFDLTTSPLIFRNYMTYSSDPDFAVNKVVDNEFYVKSAVFMSSDTYFGMQSDQKECTVNGYETLVTEYARPYRKGMAFYFSYEIR